MADNDLDKITGAVEDAVTYPILTREVDGYSGGGRGSQPPGSVSGISPTRTAQETIRQVLGWRYRGQDTKGFLAALNRAFDLKDVEGHTEWAWKPQNYMVQADLGQVTGAQASILTRAKVVVEHALPLLEGLTPLRDDADEDAMESVRSIIRNALNELLREFGAARGPRVQRVEDYFDQLLGTNPDPTSPETVGGYLGVLRERFGLDRVRVNTITEEQNLTNSLILVDYAITLQQTWLANRRYFDRLRRAEPFLGTQLVLLSQTLESVAESVHEAYDAMDSVYFSAVERQTTDIPLVDKNGKALTDEKGNPLFDGKGKTPSPMTIAELLGWVEDFATAEARQLIQDAGKDGVVAVRRTLRQLRLLVSAARLKSEEDTGSLGRGFHSNRVRRALQELETQLVKAHQLAADVRPAVLASVEPPEVRADWDEPTNISLIGDGLSQDGNVYLIGPANQRIGARSATVVSSRQLLVQFDLGDPKVETGSWDVEFAPEDGPSIVLADALTIIVPLPNIDNVTVTRGTAGSNISLAITGKSFRREATVELSPQGGASPIDAKVPKIVDSETIDAEFENVPAGKSTVRVTNPDGGHAEKDVEIEQAPAPKITSITSRDHHPVKNVPLTVGGENFDAKEVKLTKGNASISGDITTSLSTRVVAEFDLQGVEAGNWQLTLTNKDGLYGTHDYIITAFPPSFDNGADAITPNHGKPDETFPVTIKGTHFQEQAEIKFGQGITVTQTNFIDDKTLRAVIAIDHGAKGKRDVSVTNKDGQKATKRNAFTINA